MDKLNVKSGDEVIFSPPGTWSKSRIEKVEKVTPTGRIKVCGITFNEIGWQIGGDRWGRCSISQATPEEVTEIQHRTVIDNTMNKLSRIKTLTYEQAVVINDILDGQISIISKSNNNHCMGI